MEVEELERARRVFLSRAMRDDREIDDLFADLIPPADPHLFADLIPPAVHADLTGIPPEAVGGQLLQQAARVRDVRYMKTARQIYDDYKSAEALFVAVEVAVRREHLKHDLSAAFEASRPALPIEAIALVAEFAVESQLPNHSASSLATIIKDRAMTGAGDPLEEDLARGLANALRSSRVRSLVYTVQKDAQKVWCGAEWKQVLKQQWKPIQEQLSDSSSFRRETVSSTRTRVCLSKLDICDRRRSSLLSHLPRVAKGMPRFLPPQYIGWEFNPEDECLYCIVKKRKIRSSRFLHHY